MHIDISSLLLFLVFAILGLVLNFGAGIIAIDMKRYSSLNRYVAMATGLLIPIPYMAALFLFWAIITQTMISLIKGD